MKNKLLKIINTYGIMPQLKYFQSEVFELNEAIIKNENIEHIAEELADVSVMLEQFKLYYNIKNEDIEKIMDYKIDRQIKRIEMGG